MRKLTVGQRQLATWAGIIGPLLFVAIFMIEGFLRPEYNWLTTYVSALSLGRRGWVQIVNFILFGALFLVFMRAVAAEFQSGKASKWGIILLTIIASCYLLSGPFVEDLTGTPLNQSTFHGLLHGIFGGIVFSLMPVVCFVFLRRFREDPKWRPLYWWTLVMGIICAAAVVLMTIAIKIPGTQNVFKDWIGLIQRAAIIPFMIWLFIFAVGLLRRLKQS